MRSQIILYRLYKERSCVLDDLYSLNDLFKVEFGLKSLIENSNRLKQAQAPGKLMIKVITL